MNRLLDLTKQPGRRLRMHAGASGQLLLGRDRVYILPTPTGLLFAATVFLMLLGSINYGLGLGFALTFLLAGVGVTAMLLTYRNLAGLTLCAYDALPVFAGERAAFPLELRNSSRTARIAVEVGPRTLDAGSPTPAYCDVAGSTTLSLPISVDATSRGTLRLPPLKISSAFPLGLFRAWCLVEYTAVCTVYPRPEPKTVAAPAPSSDTNRASLPGEDFSGLRSYREGDTPAHIAWSALARGAGLATKQFQRESEAEIWIRWDSVSPALPTEQALSRMTRWVLDLEHGNRAFGLDIPGCRLEPDSGSAHVRACLRTLAAFEDRP